MECVPILVSIRSSRYIPPILELLDGVFEYNILKYYTVKLVYKDRHRDQQNMVAIHRWSLYTGSNKMESIPPADL